MLNNDDSQSYIKLYLSLKLYADSLKLYKSEEFSTNMVCVLCNKDIQRQKFEQHLIFKIHSSIILCIKLN